MKKVTLLATTAKFTAECLMNALRDGSDVEVSSHEVLVELYKLAVAGKDEDIVFISDNSAMSLELLGRLLDRGFDVLPTSKPKQRQKQFALTIDSPSFVHSAVATSHSMDRLLEWMRLSENCHDIKVANRGNDLACGTVKYFNRPDCVWRIFHVEMV